MSKYTIGIDFGTLSARAVLIELDSGYEVSSKEFAYPHAVMTYEDFGEYSGKDSALQHPQDYLDAVSYTVNGVISESKVDASDIIGIGIDFTASTIMPILSDGTPMCFHEKYKDNPHAYVKLWKHHGANSEAEEITNTAIECSEEWINDYGGKISSEWLFPKMLETLRCSPELFKETDRFIEAGEWVVSQLIGKEIRSACMAGFKGQWDKTAGYPSNKFWAKFGNDFSNIIGTKVSENVLPAGDNAGKLCEYGCKLTGLTDNTVVAVPLIDAHAALPASGIVKPGKLMIIVGTSCCHILISDKNVKIPGICGKVEDGVIPGYVAYEAGQCCAGDMFACFVENYIPERYTREATEKGMDIFRFITEKAAQLKVGENRLIALDWWNGNRSPYVDYELSGALVGLTLSTTPEQIFRALLESCAYGTKAIVDCFEKGGIEISEIYASGGITKKNTLLMQIFADVLGKPIKTTSGNPSGARGSAILACAAAGYYDTLEEAATKLCEKYDTEYLPDKDNHILYQKLYEEYHTLAEYFAVSGNNVMKKLKNI